MRPHTTDSSQLREQGFSLIEVLVAVAILGFVALGIASLFSQATLVNASGFDYAQLASEGRRALETCKSLPYEDAALDLTSGSPVNITTRIAGYQPPRLFVIMISIDEFDLQSATDFADMTAWPPVAAANDGNVKRVTVRVSVNDLGRAQMIGRREFVATTLLVRG